MTTGGEMVVAVREDVAQLAREGQASFEALAFTSSEIPPWRSVSDSEGIAAIALLACGQQGSVGRSSSRGDPAPNGRVDSSAWPDLLASGGETPCPPGGAGRFKSPLGGDEGQGTTTNSNNSGESSSNKDAGGSGNSGRAMPEESEATPLELGPMPSLPPFGGYRQGGGGSGGGDGSDTGSRSGSGSRSTGGRRKADGSRNSATNNMQSLGASVSTSFINTLFEPNLLGSRSSSSSSSSSSGSNSNSNGNRNSGGSAAAIPRANAGGGSSLVGAHPTDHPARRGGGGNSSSLGDMTPRPWRSAQHQNDVGPMRQRSFDPDKEIEIEDKNVGALLGSWATPSAAAATAAAVAAAAAKAAAAVAAVQVGVSDRAGLVAAASSRQKGDGFPAGTCVRAPTSVCSGDWGEVEATAVRHDDRRGGGGGGRGGETGGRIEYLNNGDYVIPLPPSSSSTSFSLQTHPSWVRPGTGPIERTGSRRNGGHDDGRQQRTARKWASQQPPMHRASTAAIVEHPIKPSPAARSYEQRPGRAQMHAQHHHHHPHPHHDQPPISRRGRTADRGREMEMEATAAAAAAAAAAPAQTPPSPPPTVPTPSPPPSPPRRAAAIVEAAPNRARGEQQKQEQHSTRKDGAPGNEYNLLAMMIPDLTRLGAGRSTGGTGVKAEEGPGNGLSSGNPQRTAAGGAFGVAGGAAYAGGAETSPISSSFPAKDSLVDERMAMLSAGGYSGGGASLCEEEARKARKKVSIARYLRKRLRRPYVKAEREQDPNRQIQNQSRMRPRKRGKFCKNAPDFIAITRVQASSNRSISGEMPMRDPPAPIRGAQTVARGVGGSGSRVGFGVGGGMSAMAWPALGEGIKQQ